MIGWILSAAVAVMYVLHQDFWDPATGIYEHLPLVGNAIRQIKARL